MRMPWLNSAYSKPRSRISRSMARPSVWRWEFQQVDREYMDKINWPSAVFLGPHSAFLLQKGSHIRITGAQHGGKARGLHLAAALLARLLKMPMVTDFLQRALPVDFLFQPAQRLV